jgi:hypothetical protein
MGGTSSQEVKDPVLRPQTPDKPKPVNPYTVDATEKYVRVTREMLNSLQEELKTRSDEHVVIIQGNTLLSNWYQSDIWKHKTKENSWIEYLDCAMKNRFDTTTDTRLKAARLCRSVMYDLEYEQEQEDEEEDEEDEEDEDEDEDDEDED